MQKALLVYGDRGCSPGEQYRARIVWDVSDDPCVLLKIVRRSFDEDGSPLEVQFLTDRGDAHRLHSSFPLFASGIPEAVREK